MAHSLGGMYARYMVKLLFDGGLFSKLVPLMFITLATPHMGARHFTQVFGSRATELITPAFVGLTGEILFSLFSLFLYQLFVVSFAG